MKFLILTLLLALALTACGSNKITCEGPTELCGPVEAFKTEAASRGVMDLIGTTVKFVDSSAKMPLNSEVGHCEALDGLGNQVIVNKAAFEGMDSQMQEALIFHELGHCALGRKHRTDTIEGSPASLMWPTSGTDAYVHHRDFYLNELFTAQVDGGLWK